MRARHTRVRGLRLLRVLLLGLCACVCIYQVYAKLTEPGNFIPTTKTERGREIERQREREREREQANSYYYNTLLTKHS